jgi:hypothetical protein
MVIMVSSSQRVAGVVLAVVALAGCGGSAISGGPPGDQDHQASGDAGPGDGATVGAGGVVGGDAPDGGGVARRAHATTGIETGPASLPGPGAALAANLEQAAERAGAVGEASSGDGVATLDGTDSTPALAPEPDAALVARLTRFGEVYLAYDYRVLIADQLATVQDLVAPGLYETLTVPLPPALEEALARQQLVVTAIPVEVTGIEVRPDGGEVYHLSFTVTESRRVEGQTVSLEMASIEHLTVVVGADDRVVDVR